MEPLLVFPLWKYLDGNGVSIIRLDEVNRIKLGLFNLIDTCEFIKQAQTKLNNIEESIGIL